MKARAEYLVLLSDRSHVWDVIVIGGGATGLGSAVDAASRGCSVLLLEKGDFASGTSSRSTKLIHGGVRYLQQGNIRLVREALHERTLLLENAPEIVHTLPFVIPLYDWWEVPFLAVGLKCYDLLAGRHSVTPSRHLSRDETIRLLPTACRKGLKGGVIYHDAQFDDAGLAVALAETLAELGGVPLNYAEVCGYLKMNGRIKGVVVQDVESGRHYELKGRAVINATGVFADDLRQLDQADTPPLLRLSQGAHIVLDRSFLPGDSALLVPHTSDGRVLFAIPWSGRVLIGTTDTAVAKAVKDPVPLLQEVDFLLSHAARYLNRAPSPRDILSMFAGLRPLAGAGRGGATADLSRGHQIITDHSGLITVIGGKWTTYRRMGEGAVNAAALSAGLNLPGSKTASLRISSIVNPDASLLSGRFHPELDVTAASVLFWTRQQGARTVEDILARRSRALFLDATASMQIAGQVACVMASELGRGGEWVGAETLRFCRTAKGFLPADSVP